MKGLRQVFRSPWAPFLVFIGIFGAYYSYRQLRVVTGIDSTYELKSDLLVRGNPELREIALTFDDGPYGETTEQILAALKQHGVKATFFVVGKHVEKREELVRKILLEGHEIGNHTYSHLRLPDLSLELARTELELCESAFIKATGSHMNLMRPPGMNYNDNILQLAQEFGYATIHWNVVVGDYLPLEPEVIVERVMSQVNNGSVVLLHDSPYTAKALPELLRRLKAEGYRFVTTTQMLSRLPRPVVLASNAGQVLLADSTPIAVETKVKTPRRGSKKVVPSADVATQRMPVDASTWEGSKPPQEEKRQGSSFSVT